MSPASPPSRTAASTTASSAVTTASHAVQRGNSAPLWRQLNATAGVLAAVRNGRSWTTAQLDVEPALRPGVQALSFAVLRQYGMAQALRSQLVQRAPSPAADALLCCVLALAVTTSAPAVLPDTSDNAKSNDSNTPNSNATNANTATYEPHTLVNQAVEAAKRNPATRAQANFINACLRRFLRERDALVNTALQQPMAQWNHPAWWLQRLRQDYPSQWQSIAQANAQAAPLTLRVNTCVTTVAAYQDALQAQGLPSVAVGQSGLELARSTYVPGLPGYAQGWFSVQDAAAQLAAPLLLEAIALSKASTPLRVLDACAAPGGKTAHLLEYAAAHGWPIEVIALDVDAARCQRIHDNLARLNLKATVLAADAAQPQAWWDGQPFDAILLDAPCSASGIVRRHPEIRWLRRETDIAQLGQLQQTLLNALWPLLKPAAPLLYCTCSVFKAEGQAQIQTFVTHHTDTVLRPSPGHLLPQITSLPEAIADNHLGGHDGFFYALLVKAALLPS
jgi:16S rRNA (cytosine967-C5)-methyltransferase